MGEGLVLRVGDDQWACQLHSKSTLVLRMLSGIYIFEDVAGKPECEYLCLPGTLQLLIAFYELSFSIR